MKPSILLLAVISAVAFSSCTTAYKTGQTPDDVYFSPTTPEDEYVRVEKKEERRYEGSDEYYDDRYLRMRVQNRARWSELDDWYYYGNRYTYAYSYYNPWGIHNPWNPYTYWNCAYNPYYHGSIIIGPNSPTYSKPRFFNLNAYNNNSLTNNTYNPKGGGINIGSNPGNFGNNSYTNPNRGSNAGSFLRDIFSGNNNNNSSGSRTTPSAGSNNNNSSSSGSSGSKGSSAPTRRF